MEKQVDKKIYDFFNYSSPGRFASYYYQLKEVLSLKPATVLEIGVGDKVFASYLKNNTEIDYKCLDVAEDLGPDILSSADKIPLNENEIDLVCAFEVLEHLPYDMLEASLSEMRRVAGKHVVISLPHWGRHFAIEFRLPFFKKLRWQYKYDASPIEHQFNGQHYWEIGKKGYPLKKIKKSIIKVGFSIEKEYIPYEMPYHHFFILKK